LLVPGGSFFLGPASAAPATISSFRLDKYEVTVGRFRKFLAAWLGGWRPAPGSGKHAHLNGGAGLDNTAGGSEPGWSSTWNDYVGGVNAPSNLPGLPALNKAQWDILLGGSDASGYAVWTKESGANERRPQNWLNWYDLHAFCIWDGGFLPSEAEWEFAAAGGGEERMYPWGSAPLNGTLAVAYMGSGSSDKTVDVGSRPAGDGRWGHSDLAGNAGEWTLDFFQVTLVHCVDCVGLAPSTSRVLRGGASSSSAEKLVNAHRLGGFAANRGPWGGRCARRP
jgi:formylglycine-generating enzyme required for sulfatase activity